MPTITDLLTEARAWVGTPYAHGQRAKGLGCDCIGFVWGVAATVGLADHVTPEATAPFLGYGREPDPANFGRALGRFLTPVVGGLPTARPGDVLWCRVRRQPRHVALLGERGTLLHALAGCGVVETTFDARWRSLVAAVFRFPAFAECPPMQLVLSVAGNAIAGPVGGMVGALVGGYLDARLFAPDRPDVQGPRLNDLRIGGSAYGAPIPLVYETYRVGGQLLWATDILEVAASDEVGGKGGPSYTSTSYSYYGAFAVGLCAANPGPAPITGVSQIFADGRLIWEDGDPAGSPYNEHIRVHLGGLDQLPDPLIEAQEGVGNVSALQHWCYVVFDHLPLADFGNRLPTITAVVRNGEGTTEVDPEVVFTSGHVRALNTSQFGITGEIPDRHGQMYVASTARVLGFTPDGAVFWDLSPASIAAFLQSAGYTWHPAPYTLGPSYPMITAAAVAGGAYVAVVVHQMYCTGSNSCFYRDIIVLAQPQAGAPPTPLAVAWCAGGLNGIVASGNEGRLFSIGSHGDDDPIVFEAFNDNLDRLMRVFPSPAELLAGYPAGWGGPRPAASTPPAGRPTRSRW